MSKNENKVHFIAIGGVVMHSLAIAMKEKGYEVSGSDDQIFDPSKSNLAKHGILPEIGWNTDKITEDLGAVILGMHAKADNPELEKAKALGLNIFSYPEYIFEQSKHKQRIVIGGSHGKTTITAMIMHVLKFLNRDFDYLVGSHVAGFDNMVKLTDAPIIIIEGDEYLTSPLDSTPKFLHYHAHIALISGIAWDHMNVFPTEEGYVTEFEKFADALPKSGSFIYNDEDPLTTLIGNKDREDVKKYKYTTLNHEIAGGITHLITDSKKIPLKIFGKHNMQNLAGAKEVLAKIGVLEDKFYDAIQSFEGAAKRLEVIKQDENSAIYKDFAHAPSKVKATVTAVKEQSNRELIACYELHTFSSLNKAFLPQFANSLDKADTAVIYYNPATSSHKGLEVLDENTIKKAFDNDKLKVFTDSTELVSFINSLGIENKSLLMMSSGNFGGIDFSIL